jgi:hypothetical protein
VQIRTLETWKQNGAKDRSGSSVGKSNYYFVQVISHQTQVDFLAACLQYSLGSSSPGGKYLLGHDYVTVLKKTALDLATSQQADIRRR